MSVAAEPTPISLAVSALVIGRNQAEAVRATLTSLERTTPREMLEILYVDCGSRDGSPAMEPEFPGVSFLKMPRNFGWTKAANVGTRTAKGEFLFIVPPGTVITEPSTVEKLKAALESDSSANGVSPAERDAASGAIVSTAYSLPSSDDFARRRAQGNWGPSAKPVSGMEPIAAEFPAGAPILVRRQSVVQINYFDDRYGQFGADLDFFYQVKRAGKRMVIRPDIVVERQGERAPELAFGYDPTDLAHGAAAYLGKWSGFGAGLTARLGSSVGMLGKMQFGGFARVLSGGKIDGTQGE